MKNLGHAIINASRTLNQRIPIHHKPHKANKLSNKPISCIRWVLRRCNCPLLRQRGCHRTRWRIGRLGSRWKSQIRNVPRPCFQPFRGWCVWTMMMKKRTRKKTMASLGLAWTEQFALVQNCASWVWVSCRHKRLHLSLPGKSFCDMNKINLMIYMFN